jgi:Domain of unknown function (DUF4384)
MSICFKLKSILTLLCCLQCVCGNNVFAIPIDVKAEFYFGPDLSRNQACENARESAKSKAIAMVSGEKISFDQQLQCFQRSKNSDERKCEINQNTAFLVEGQISRSETISEIVKTVPGAQVCTVLMVVDVIPPSLESDPSFDFKFEINRTNFRQGDNLIINLIPSKMMYVYIFNWRSAFNKENVIKIFPNEVDKDNYIIKSITIPTKNSDSKYSFELDWDAPNGYDKDFMNESIIVVATKKPIDWLSSYDIKRFKEKIMEIPLNQRRVIRKSFMLFR